MPRNALTGTRIRERRMLIGMRQAELARAAGVSAAYLNLIEHNRRRVGPDLVARLAGELGLEPVVLEEGGESTLIETLREAAADGAPARAGQPVQAPEIDRIEEFVGRFPGWAAQLAERQGRVATLERQVSALSERLTHDPFLSAALHEVLSVVTSVRSTAAILAESEGLGAELQARFHRNIHDDSLRLSRASAALVTYLDRTEDAAGTPGGPEAEFEGWLAAADWHFPALEDGSGANAAETVERSGLDGAARNLAEVYLRQAAGDAALMPLEPFVALAREAEFDPARIAGRSGLPQAAVFRRLAGLPARPDLPVFGLAVCDGSGALVFRRPVPGFAPPRHGAGCPLWPLYEALSRPGVPVRRVIEVAGRGPGVFVAHAWCDTFHPDGAAGPQLARAMMLLREQGGRTGGRGRAGAGEATLPVGTVCRLCPRSGCAARREASVLEEASAPGARDQIGFDSRLPDAR